MFDKSFKKMKYQPKPEIRQAYIAAANEGDLYAAYKLATFADDAGAWFECLTWLEPAIKKEFPPALYFLSTKYIDGRGVPQDFFEAKRLAQESARLGHYPATLLMADFHSTHKYHNFNLDEEWIWLSRAGELEPEHWGYNPCRSARFKVANRLIQSSYLAWSERQPLGLSDSLLAGSKILTEDECIKSAEKLLLELSAEEIFDSKNPDDADPSEYWRGTGTDRSYTATGLLARLYMDSQSACENYELGLEFLKKGAEIKDPECCYRLAVMLFSGDKLSTNKREAACLWHELGNREHGDVFQILSCYAYSMSCLEGAGIMRDEEEAKEWFGYAADEADPLAQFELGLCFLNGIGCSINNQDAYFWFNLSAALGCDGAVEFREKSAAKLKPKDLTQIQEKCREFFNDKAGDWQDSLRNIPIVRRRYPVKFSSSSTQHP
jgi:TPR repeat protein